MSLETNSKKPDYCRSWYRRWWLWLIPAVAASIVFGGPKVKRLYGRWNAGRLSKHAMQLIAEGDYNRAMFEARTVLQANPNDAGATRIMAKAFEGMGSAAPAAQWRSRLDAIRPNDQENLLAWASDFVKTGDAVAASRILASLKPEPRDNADYHATAASVAEAKRDTVAAESHWAEAARIKPQDDAYRLHLALVRLGSKDSAQHESAIEMLRDISQRPAKKAEALRTLCGDAMHYQDWKKALEHADALAAIPGTPFSDKITRLETLRTVKPLDSSTYLDELRNAALSNPADLYLLLMWMNQHDLSILVSEWSRSLPQDVIFMPPTCVAVADAYVRTFDWERLRTFLDERSWGESDYLRRAFLARDLEKLGDADQSALEWKDGLAAAGSRADSTQRLERIARLAISWGWEQRAQEVMWGLVNSPNCPRWMIEALWAIAVEFTDAQQLQKLAGLRVRADAKSAELRNYYAFYSLLMHSEDGSPHREAERLFHENPGDAAIAVTRALSLHQQGKNDEALAITANLPAAELAKPQPAFYHALFLTAKGESARAAAYLAAASDRKMFPEEKSLLDRAGQLATKAADAQGIAEAAKAARAAKAANDSEVEKAVEAARAARVQTAQADDDSLLQLIKARRAARAAEDAESEKAVRAVRAARKIAAPQIATQEK